MLPDAYAKPAKELAEQRVVLAGYGLADVLKAVASVSTGPHARIVRATFREVKDAMPPLKAFTTWTKARE